MRLLDGVLAGERAAALLLLRRPPVLQLVEHRAHLLLQRERVDLLPVGVRVLRRLHFSARGIEEEGRRIERVAVLLLTLLSPKSGTRVCQLRLQRELGQRGDEGAQVHHLRHRRHHVPGGVGVLAHEDPRLFIHLCRVRGALVVHEVLPLVARAAALHKCQVVRLARRHHGVEVVRALLAARAPLSLGKLPRERLVVFLVDHYDGAPFQECVNHVGGKPQPHLVEVGGERRRELDVLAVATHGEPALEQLTVQDAARRRDRRMRGVQLFERLHLRRVDPELAGPARAAEPD